MGMAKGWLERVVSKLCTSTTIRASTSTNTCCATTFNGETWIILLRGQKTVWGSTTSTWNDNTKYPKRNGTKYHFECDCQWWYLWRIKRTNTTTLDETRIPWMVVLHQIKIFRIIVKRQIRIEKVESTY